MVKSIRCCFTALALASALALAGCGKQEQAKVEKAAAEVKAKVETEAKAVADAAKELEAREAAIDAYVYAYPLVTMEITRRVMTNVEKAEGSKAPMGHFAACARTRQSTITRSPRPMPTRCTPWPGSTSPRSRGSSASRT